MAGVLTLAVESAEDGTQLKAAWLKVKPALDEGRITEVEAGRLNALVRQRKDAMEPKAVSE